MPYSLSIWRKKIEYFHRNIRIRLNIKCAQRCASHFIDFFPFLFIRPWTLYTFCVLHFVVGACRHANFFFSETRGFIVGALHACEIGHHLTCILCYTLFLIFSPHNWTLYLTRFRKFLIQKLINTFEIIWMFPEHIFEYNFTDDNFITLISMKNSVL